MEIFFWLIFSSFSISTICGILVYFVIEYRGKQTCSESLESYPKVGIIVPHFNEKVKYLLQCLESIESQEYPRSFVVLLADDGSTNNIQTPLKAWLSKPRKNTYISHRFENNHKTKGKVMDASLHLFPDDIDALVVVDSDTFIAPQSVKKIVERLWRSSKCVAVCGYVVPADEDKTRLQQFQSSEHFGVFPILKSAQDMFGLVSVMAGAFVVHRMSTVKELGGWSKWLVEDVAWTWKALAHGYETGYVPEAVAYTYGPVSYKDLFKQRRRWARGRVEAQKEAWKVAKSRRFLLLFMFMQYINELMLPTLLLFPILAGVSLYLGYWWVIPLIGLSMFMSVAVIVRYQRNIPQAMRKSIKEIVFTNYYKTLFEICIWKPNLLGLFDEILGKSKVWLTR